MKTIFENVIERGGYDLTGLLNRIDSYHVMGRLTDDKHCKGDDYLLRGDIMRYQWQIRADEMAPGGIRR